ncbi:MAG TPA: SdrD B-like domain-containing protein, partial [Ilumatobacteraceae bacterium]|nr:SdrD B-like domain-containing protein [Ilumatobacteraceae bacterium]
VVTFDLLVDAGVTPGTLIVNQAVLDTAELPNLLTDGDGNPATGPEPTVVVVGDVQQLRITKDVAVVGGGPAIAGATLEYVVSVTNIGAVPAYEVVVRDDLDAMPGYLQYVAGSATLNGSTNGVVVAGQLLTGNYSTVYGPLQPGRAVTLRFRAVLNANLAIGTRVTNTGTVYWNNPVQQASASIAIDVGGIPGVGLINGRVWHDADFDNVFDANEQPLAGWDVELYLNGSLAHTARTAADGIYRMSGVEPNYATPDTYELRFRRPGAVTTTAMLGLADSAFTNDLQRVTDIVVLSGSNLQNLNLPIDPNGIIYDALSRAPIQGATVTLASAGGSALPSSCFYDANQQGQITLGDGFYKFDLSFADPACPSGGSYLLQITPPSSRWLTGVSTIIPPTSSATTNAFIVPSCPTSVDDAVPATAQYCEATPSEIQPPASVAPGTSGTTYYLHLTFDSSLVPGSSQIFNNHIPLDLDLDESVAITKTTPMINVARGQLVPYVITIANGVGVNLSDVTVVDRFPAGFRYVEGSARLDGEPREPIVAGRELSWPGLTVTTDGRHTLMLVLAVGSGVGEGEFVNHAQAMSAFSGNPLSGEASATVRIVPDPALDCTDVIGKVFDDANRNGLQDDGEQGIPQVRLATARGLLATTDQYGRFHITCAITPHEG